MSHLARFAPVAGLAVGLSLVGVATVVPLNVADASPPVVVPTQTVVTVPPAPRSGPAEPVSTTCLAARLAVHRAVTALNDEVTRLNQHPSLANRQRAAQAAHDRAVVTSAILRGC